MGFWLLIPFLLLRFGLMALVNKTAIGRAAYFAPLPQSQQPAYWVYLVSNLGILVYLCFLRIATAPPLLFYAGLALYAAGTVLLGVTVVHFAFPAPSGVNQSGVYRFSRNPMYVAYFLVFLGAALLCQSWLLFALVLVFQISTHWIILAEERWCADQFGDEYLQYKQRVRRYL